MDATYRNILRNLSNNNIEKLTIPELGLIYSSSNMALTALYLMPFCRRNLPEVDETYVENLNKEKVIEAMNLIKDMDESEINYIVIIGRNAHNALNVLKKKYSDIIANDDKFSVIANPNEIHVPIKMGKVLSDDSTMLSELLSLTGVTVINYDESKARVYCQGEKITMEYIDAPGYIRFVGSLGFYIDEYLFGEFFYKISKLREDIYELLLANLDTLFVRSLNNIFYDNHDRNRRFSKRLKNNPNYDLNRLFAIIDAFGINHIKNMEYEFVSVMLYEG